MLRNAGYSDRRAFDCHTCPNPLFLGSPAEAPGSSASASAYHGKTLSIGALVQAHSQGTLSAVIDSVAWPHTLLAGFD